MSKKIMKRSLALGALMAFVITGSAFAEEINLALKGDTTVGEISSSSHSAYDGNAVLGGAQYGLEADNETNNLGVDFKNFDETQIIIKDGVWDDVIGGNQSAQIANVEDEANRPTLSIGETNVTINGGEVKRVIGGSRTDSAGYVKMNTGTTNVYIGKGVTVKKEIIGGDFLKLYGSGYYTGDTVKYPANVINDSYITNTNVVIDEANVKWFVFGGSVADVFYGHDNGIHTLKTVVQNANLTIKNANVESNIFGAGGAFDKGCSSTVNNVDMKIIGGEYAKDIYSGGLLVDTGSNNKSAAPTLSVGKAVVDIFDAEIAGFYAANAVSDKPYITNAPNNMELTKGVDVYTNLGLTGVTAQTVDVQLGTVTLKAEKTTDKTTINNLQVAQIDQVSLIGTKELHEALTGDANEKAATFVEMFEVKSAIDLSGIDTSLEESKVDGQIDIDVKHDSTTGKFTVQDVTEQVNISNEGIVNMANIGLISWRAETNDMNKRLGELRNANGEHGVWVRMVRGEDEYGNVKHQYNQYQLGYDEKLSTDKRWTVGAAINYTDAETSFSRGNGESTNKALSIYGSKLNADGTFIDLIAKYARLENDFTASGGMREADYGTNAYSFSAEAGKRIQQGKGMWIEPQVELTYGKVANANYVSENGVRFTQDSIDSLVGRIGFSLGKDIKQGNVYARASYLYDFEGDTRINVTDIAAAKSKEFKDDLGGGWWEVGVGANINLSDATYIYADVEKTFGGEVDTNWQWNLGVRYSF